ncbi:2-C-methyl-D-erythritol 2,4-cyclodiphosphate synthase [Paraglaciecola sp. MB-3u-78]|jgi:2-C-methyl-D-erythritol 2,4-cyclodiphosphate synthase|uniref:2-C-methyl-D-erythritol 2,4-cyclodiphosphate synthase n=1 Tax=Paraglaciecola sp. MB-3u-78 TaxID=2058332 RepID=UPI000C347D23|nr:2-C-methyl-D-erythritol 2,4-cyclodiphosphate synthase [Paraglaciecola sp. MB-3u-78]PKH00022.1 2-C-methyl-D-erythritol 2,4-cyclodiphosphate synthase [Paraglaciecola sp. MB-3u-78]
MSIRIGHGYDVHKFGGTGPIIIAGVKIEHDMGLVAHSDGDVVLHALCDALLGALALGDIGKHFPDTDPTLAGVDSRELLRHVYKLITDQQYQLGNLDLTIVAQAPKMAPHIALMRENIAADLSADMSQVNVKATTTEKLGFAGRKEGIAAYAVVLLTQQSVDTE